jgi:hypothetical protein
VKAAELAIAAPQVVAIRTARMLAAGANPSVADRAEFSRMGTEKVQAFGESMYAMGTQIARSNLEFARSAAWQWWRLWTTPWWVTAYRPLSQTMASLPRIAGLLPGPSQSQHQRAMTKLVEASLAPVHKRATANARRLGRTKKR